MAAIKRNRKNGTNPSFVLLVLRMQKTICSKNVSKIYATLHVKLHCLNDIINFTEFQTYGIFSHIPQE